ncbi:MAG: DoxX family protein [Polyangiaceae bacterium]|nr:DoxX family protein [Polyangiaceae bacterium]
MNTTTSSDAIDSTSRSTRSRRAKPIAIAVARTALGLFLIANAPVGTLIPVPPSGGAGDAIIAALWQSPFIMVMAKLVELSVGVSLLSNRYVPLALTLFAPVLLNIVGFQAFYVRGFLPVGLLMLTITLSLAWHHRAAYRSLFVAKSV